jgi:hypothetical protein
MRFFANVMLVLAFMLVVLWLVTVSHVAPAGVPLAPVAEPQAYWTIPSEDVAKAAIGDALKWVITDSNEVLMTINDSKHTIELLHVPRPLAEGKRWRLVYGDRAVMLDQLAEWIIKEGAAK